VELARKARVPLVIPAAIVAAWAIAFYAEFGGWSTLLHHDTLIERSPSLWVALALFSFAWAVMIAAMMLPSAFPLLKLFRITSAQQPHAGRVFAAFVSGYIVVWVAFGFAAFAGDAALHRIVDATPWLLTHSWIVAGGVLAMAGLFQFTPLKDQCLRACRLPATFLMHHYRRGSRAAFDLGYRHGLFCVGCCWALMLVAFAAGFASLWWMVALTALMTYEKIAPRGLRAVPVAGTALLVWSALVLLHPAWLPPAFGGTVR
jgi:predicted metal-binding membrane protein